MLPIIYIAFVEKMKCLRYLLTLLLELAIQTHVALTKNFMMQLDKGVSSLCGKGSVDLDSGLVRAWPFLVSSLPVLIIRQKNYQQKLCHLLFNFNISLFSNIITFSSNFSTTKTFLHISNNLTATLNCRIHFCYYTND